MARSIADAHIPKGWRYVYLDEVTGRCSGHTPSKSHDSYWNGGVKWISLTDSHRLDKGYVRDTDKKISLLGVENSSAEIHPAGTVVLSRDAGIGKSGVMAEPMAVSQHFIAWKCDNKSEMDSWFLYNWLQYFKPEFERQAVGSTIKTIGLPFFKKLRIALPPITEQRKIAKILSTWDEAIATSEQLLANSEHQKEATMQQLLTGKKRLPGFDGEWEKIELSAALNYLQPTPYLVESTEYSDDYKTPVLTAGKTFILGYTNEDFGIYKDSQPVIIFDDFTTDSRYIDFPFKVKSSAIKILTSRDGYSIKYIFEAMQMIPFSIGGHQRHWISIFSNMVIPVPCIEEQKAIAKVLSKCDQQIEILQSEIEALKEEKKALMQQLLTGKRRVKIEEEVEATTA